ncbi:MAG: phosphatidate cytidylyltransferase [Paludibacter sp.]
MSFPTNKKNVNVNPWAALVGGVLLFITSFLYSSGTWLYPAFSVYGFYIVIVFLSELYRHKSNPLNNWAYFILGQIFVALPFSLLNFILFIDEWQPLVLLSVFVTIWVNDTGAYLIGITFGKHRLFERISPKKSWEGFFGGAAAALLSGYVFSLLIPQISLINWLIFSEIIVIFGTFGDLVESLMKRTVDMKDSGNVIPGHGGLLDRFDSMLLAAPVVFIYLSFLFHQAK